MKELELATPVVLAPLTKIIVEGISYNPRVKPAEREARVTVRIGDGGRAELIVRNGECSGMRLNETPQNGVTDLLRPFNIDLPGAFDSFFTVPPADVLESLMALGVIHASLTGTVKPIP